MGSPIHRRASFSSSCPRKKLASGLSQPGRSYMGASLQSYFLLWCCWAFEAWPHLMETPVPPLDPGLPSGLLSLSS